MKKAITTIEEELSWLIKEYKATTDHHSGKFIRTLNYQLQLNKKKRKVIFQFLYMPKESSLTLNLIYRIRDHANEEHEFLFPFSKVKDDIKLEMINAYDYQRISDVMEFETVNGELKSVVSPLTQSVTYTEVIRRNIDSILAYSEDLEEQVNE